MNTTPIIMICGCGAPATYLVSGQEISGERFTDVPMCWVDKDLAVDHAVIHDLDFHVQRIA